MSWRAVGAWIAGALISCFSGCNYTEGQCYPRGQGGENAGVGGGGGVIVPNGAGGFGDVPPEPQGNDDPIPPDCNRVPDTPCYEKCLADYEAAAAECGKIVDDAQRKTCQDAAYTAYSSCRDKCQKAGNTACDDKYQDCIDNGPTKCGKKSAGKTLCYRCWERCNAGDAPSAECSECKF